MPKLSLFSSIQYRITNRAVDHFVSNDTLSGSQIVSQNKIKIRENTFDTIVGASYRYEEKPSSHFDFNISVGYSEIVSNKIKSEYFAPSNYKHDNGLLFQFGTRHHF